MTVNKLLKCSAILVVLAGLALIGLNITRRGTVSLPTKAGPPPGYYPVTHVTDGDTFDVQIAGQTEAVRLIGIDTPETHDPRKPVQCYGEAAASEAHKLLDGKSVRLVGDAQDTDRDKYHRLLRYAYLPDGTFYNQYMVEQGYAFAYIVFPNTKLDQFKSWESEAKAAGRGLWSSCQVHNDDEIEQTNAVGPVPTN
jgi:micrococcal nuclease